MADSSVIPVPNETEAEASRETQCGIPLLYKMKVIQQPQRARACGSGQKSSADRRPVDPPPIVELKIFEQTPPGVEDTEITFRMNANYFLYATLEQARPMAQPRNLQDRTQPTVLTGTPVAGMSYLERPSPAGYFIFPDLSVRHEGKYRLSFSLYEELKDPKLADKDTNPANDANGANDVHVVLRLEVKSEPFIVYSAKKFPGLASSTSLSRIVAEQGCRVRIRREVRMRKRDPKAGKDWDAYEDNDAIARSRMSATPPHYGYSTMGTPLPMDPIPRPRSAGNVSQHSMADPVSRRTSLQDMNHAYQHSHFAPPHTPQHGYPQMPAYGVSPAPPFPQPNYMQQSNHSMQPPPPQYPAQHYAPAPVSQPAPQQPFYGYGQTSASSPHNPSTSSTYDGNRFSVDYSSGQMQPDYRRSSMQQPTASTQPYSNQQAYNNYQPVSAQPSVQASYGMQTSQPYSSVDNYGARTAPIEPVQSMPQTNGSVAPSLHSRPSFAGLNTLPPINTQVLGGKLEASSPMSAGPSATFYGGGGAPLSAAESTHKRSFGNVFPSTDGWSRPLKAGARPASPYNNSFGSSSVTANAGAAAVAQDEDVDEDEGECMPVLGRMAYRRADGKMMSRAAIGPQ